MQQLPQQLLQRQRQLQWQRQLQRPPPPPPLPAQTPHLSQPTTPCRASTQRAGTLAAAVAPLLSAWLPPTAQRCAQRQRLRWPRQRLPSSPLRACALPAAQSWLQPPRACPQRASTCSSWSPWMPCTQQRRARRPSLCCAAPTQRLQPSARPWPWPCSGASRARQPALQRSWLPQQRQRSRRLRLLWLPRRQTWRGCMLRRQRGRGRWLLRWRCSSHRRCPGRTGQAQWELQAVMQE